MKNNNNKVKLHTFNIIFKNNKYLTHFFVNTTTSPLARAVFVVVNITQYSRSTCLLMANREYEKYPRYFVIK